MYGHTEKLLILPFDHRNSFAKGLFGTENPDTEMAEKIKAYKQLIYESIFAAQQQLSLPLSEMAILVDETYGDDILHDAHARGLQTIQSVEKSGLDEFSFEYGEEFGNHLLEDHASFAKALIRYNPEGDTESHQRSLERLRLLSFFCHHESIKLLIELLIPPTPEQLAAVDNDKRRYDEEMRPALTVQAIEEFQAAGIECDVWKIEGFEDAESYQEIITAVQNSPERADVGLIILGRGETRERVVSWLIAGKNIPGILGFAVGRTVFWEPLVQYHNQEISREEAVQKIANNFCYFAEVFLN